MKKITIEIDTETRRDHNQGAIKLDFSDGGSELENQVVRKLKPLLTAAIHAALGPSILADVTAPTLEEAVAKAFPIATAEQAARRATKTPIQ